MSFVGYVIRTVFSYEGDNKYLQLCILKDAVLMSSLLT